MAPIKALSKKKNPSSDTQAFRMMFESHPAIMLLIEPVTGEILDANQAALQFYGYPRESLCGRLINEMNTTPPELDAIEKKGFDSEKNSFIATHRLVSGEERLVQLQSSHLMLQKKKVLFAILYDITARRRVDERLTVERNLLTTLLDHLPDRIYVKDMLGRKIISNTADWRASGGKTPQDVLGKSDFDTYRPELAAKFWADDQSVLDSGLPVVNREEPGLDEQGNPSWVLTTKVPLMDENGKITGLVGIGRSITERKQVEDQLQESKLLFHLLIENLPQNIYAKDLEGRFIFANQRYCAILGKSLEEIVGKTDIDFYPHELAEKYQSDDRTVIETGQVLELEEENVPFVGKRIFVQVIKTPFFNSKGQTAGTLGIFWDISDRKRAEIELRRAQEDLERAHRELQLSFAREQRLAHLDELTGINNRRALVEYAEREFSIAMRYGPPLSIIMFDIDDFKRINDNFGHSIGDHVLERLTQNVCAQLRAPDIIGRYGGDEFVILLPQTNALDAVVLAERIQVCLTGMALETGRGLLRITLSIGIAQTLRPETTKRGQGDTLKELLLRADRAMYAAKQAGKNRIHISKPE